jgi:hypothetical protein
VLLLVSVFVLLHQKSKTLLVQKVQMLTPALLQWVEGICSKVLRRVRRRAVMARWRGHVRVARANSCAARWYRASIEPY